MAALTQHRPHSALAGRRFASFVGKTGTAGSAHPVGRITQHLPHGGMSGRRFGSFASKTAPGAASVPTDVAGTATSDTTATLTLTDTNAGGASYRWQIAPVSTGIFVDAGGATNPSSAGVTSFAATGLTAATEYEVQARGESGGGNSAYAAGAATFTTDNPGSGGGEIPIPTAPAITVQPADQSAAVGDTATFSVTATGTAPLTYQWSKDGTPISGATSASYTTPALILGDNGAEYTVVVTGPISPPATSSAAALSITRTLTDGRRAVYMPPLKRTVTAMRRAEILEDMDTQEDDTVRFDYTNELETGETLLDAVAGDAVVTVEVYSGTDATPSDFLSGDRQVSSPAVRQAVTSPTAGVVYLMRCRARTSLDRTLVRAAYIKGIREGA